MDTLKNTGPLRRWAFFYPMNNWLDNPLIESPNKKSFTHLCYKCAEHLGAIWPINEKTDWHILRCDRCERLVGVTQRDFWKWPSL